MVGLGKRLEILGFTGAEARAYLCLLEHGPARVGDLARQASIARTQLYPLLGAMARKGFLLEHPTKPVEYTARPPAELVGVAIREREGDLDTLSTLGGELEKIKRAEASMPYSLEIVRGERNVLNRLVGMVGRSKKVVLAGDLVAMGPGLLGALRAVGGGVTVYSNRPGIMGEYGLENAVLGGLVKERPYSALVCDGDRALIVMRGDGGERHGTGIYVEGPGVVRLFVPRLDAFELRTSLTTVKAGFEIMKKSCDEKNRKVAELIERNLNRMTAAIEDGPT